MCRVRGLRVHDTPEERVRQQLLDYLMGPFGCPKSLIGVEVSVHRLVPHRSHSLPRRRLDIVCFSCHRGTMTPLLIIECKAVPPGPEALSQLNGYNFFVRAPYLALAWPGHMSLSCRGTPLFEGALALLPTYQQLQSATLS